MTTTPLDIQTGLPALPHGQWWEVREFYGKDYDYYSGAHKVRDGYSLCVVTKVHVPAKVTKGDHWWSLSKETPAHEADEVMLEVQIVDPTVAIKYNYESYTKIGMVTISAEDVRRTAKRVMELRANSEEVEARRRESDALLGAYPPKVLV